MRVAWVVPRYVPRAPAGAEWTAHELLVECVRRGHRAAAIIVGREAHLYPDIDSVDGVAVLRPVAAGHGSYDVVIGHLGLAERCREFVRPGGQVVWMAHAPYQYDWGTAAAPDHYIANSEHVRRAGPPATWMMRPHVDPDRVTATAIPGDADHITLVGASDLKGLPLFRRIARARPHRRFLVVQSAYDRQRIAPGQRGNIDVWAPRADIRDAYARTEILCIPSVESWGRVAVEAAHNGIPVIAHPCAGMDEAMGDVYLPANRDDLNPWLEAIDYLRTPDAFTLAAECARDRAAVLDTHTRADRDDIIRRLEAIA